MNACVLNLWISETTNRKDKDSISSWSQIFKTVMEMYLEPSQGST